MRIKVDYVTNSSSEVFGVVVGDSLLVGGLVGFLAALINGCRTQHKQKDVTETQTEDVMIDASTMAEQIAEAVSEDAEKQEQIVKGCINE